MIKEHYNCLWDSPENLFDSSTIRGGVLPLLSTECRFSFIGRE